MFSALRRIDGTYVLNGNWAINWSGDFNAGGTPFSYTRDDDSHVESIFSPGPLLEPLDLMVTVIIFLGNKYRTNIVVVYLQ